jgi:hypothetical protein
VNSATLTLTVFDPSASPPADIHTSLVDWAQETATWDNFGGEAGVQPDELGADIGDAPTTVGTHVLDITTAVQGWVDDPQSNLGLILVPNSWNGVLVRSSEYAVEAERPLLTVEYVPTICDSDDDCGFGQFCNMTTNRCEIAPSLPVAMDDDWRYLKGTAEPPTSWNTNGFDDSTWSEGAGGIGYDYYEETGGNNGNGDYEPYIRTTLPDMRRCTPVDPPLCNDPGYVSVYMRREFLVDNPTLVTSLTFRIYADDGYVAYLNGTEIARARLTGVPPAYDTLADVLGAGPTPPVDEVIDASGFISLLVPGINVLAVQGHNGTPGSRDLLMIPQLASMEVPPCTGPEDCDDGNLCNGVETCGEDQACQPGTSAPNGTPCPDGDICNGDEICNADVCEAGIPLPDRDGDGVCDPIDVCPDVHDPSQANDDDDDYGNACDCGPNDDQVWALPGEVQELSLSHAGGVLGSTTLTWVPPMEIGGVSIVYDTLRSSVAADFVSVGTIVCVESDDGTDTSSNDPGAPANDVVYFFLVRSGNACGDGPLGNDSADDPRPGGDCP